MSALFEPIKVGNMLLQNRLAMAPLTRMRATSSHTHTAMATEYYAQRSNTPGTLIISEATFVEEAAGGFAHVPGVWSDAQVQAWKEIVTAVHAKKSFMYLQLWALGRAAPAAFLAASPGGPFNVVSASNIGLDPKGESRGKDVPTPLSVEQIKQYVGWYAQAAKNFVEKAGGDGVEVHCANGYLIDQFLQKNSNVRTDAYGGSLENRCRFGLEVIDAVVKAVGAEKVGFRLSPHSTFQGMKMAPADIEETFSYFARAIKKAHPNLAYLHATEARVAGGGDQSSHEEETLDFLHDIWAPKNFIVAGTYTAETAIEATTKRTNVIVAFGRFFISNPDLPERIRNHVPFVPYNRKTFYLLGETQNEGYTDYPAATEAELAAGRAKGKL